MIGELTKKQRGRLRRECLKLAMECVNGTAPEFGRGTKFADGQPWCVAGHLQIRAGLGKHVVLSDAAFTEATLLITANDRAGPTDRHGAVVFPLLALADALEESP